MMTHESDFEEVVTLALRLSPVEKVRLLERLAVTLEQDLQPKQALRSLYGSFADLGDAPSAEAIDDTRREVWSNFPREDV
jgi:hypothetical protein